MSDQDTTITADGLAQMLDQFKGSTNLRLLASSYLDQAQALEDAIWPLLGERGLANATGDRLDGIGEIVKTPRGGRDDTTYRLALIVKLAVLQSTGTEADLVTIAELAIQMGTPDYEFAENFPKGVTIRPMDNAVSASLSMLAASGLRRSVSAGTTFFLITSTKADSLIYTLSSQVATLETSSTLGLANDAQSTGGYMTYAY